MPRKPGEPIFGVMPDKEKSGFRLRNRSISFSFSSTVMLLVEYIKVPLGFTFSATLLIRLH